MEEELMECSFSDDFITKCIMSKHNLDNFLAGVEQIIKNKKFKKERQCYMFGAIMINGKISAMDLSPVVGESLKIELFAREKRIGWDVWGNEVRSDIKL